MAARMSATRARALFSEQDLAHLFEQLLIDLLSLRCLVAGADRAISAATTESAAMSSAEAAAAMAP